jgi:hypothetical protein
MSPVASKALKSGWCVMDTLNLLAPARITSLACQRSFDTAITHGDDTYKAHRSAARVDVFCEKHKSG